MSYKIVWFDDEFNSSLESIKAQFDDYGIRYKGFENADQGIQYIHGNLHQIDAIVIDGNFFKSKEDRLIDETGKALNMVVDALKESKFKKEIPYFVLSGKINFRERRNVLVDILGIEKVYDKLKEDDTEELCKAIIKKSNSTLIGSLKIKYNDVFSMCQEGKLGNECFEKIVGLAQAVERPVLFETSEDLFLSIRKVLEKLFISLSKIGIIDKDLLDQKGWINGCSAFISNRHSAYSTENLGIHPVVQDTVFRILNFTQDSAHAEGGLKLRVDEYCNKNRNNYLFKGSIFMLFEIVAYFGKFIDENLDFEQNSSKWSKKLSSSGETAVCPKDNLIIGKVINLNQVKGFAFFEPDSPGENVFIPPHLVTKHCLVNDMTVEVEIEEYSEGNVLRTKVISCRTVK